MKTEGERVAHYLKQSGAEVPAKYASGGRASKPTNTTINITVGKAGPDPAMLAGLAAAAKPPVVNPQPAPPMPPPGMGAPGGPPGMAPGMKRGGRATAEPMNAGSVSGDGRQNKTISQAKASGQKQPVKGTFRTAK